MTDTTKQKQAILMMIMCASLWSIAGIFIKLLPWHPLVIAGFRSLIASCVVFLFMCFSKIAIVFNRDSIISGVFMSLTFLAFVTANKLTTSANAIVLQFTAPVFILILSAIIYKQHFYKADFIVVTATLLGISLFFFDRFTPGNMLGNFIGICSGLFMAIMFLTTGHANESSRMSGILLGHIFTAVVGVPIAFIYPTPVTTGAVLSILALGIVQLGIPYVLFVLAIRDCPVLACSLLGAIEPLLNPVWVFLFDGEAPGRYALVGGLIAITVITIWYTWCKRHLQVINL